MNNSLIKVNFEVYSTILLKFGSTTKRPYKHVVEVGKGLTLNIKPNVANNNITLVINRSTLTVSTVQYDHLLIVFSNTPKRQFSRALNVNDPTTVVIYKPFSAPKKASRRNYQQDPTTMKKGKYRHRSKAFWIKRSDLPRGKYSRDQRFKALTDLHVDAKISRVYSFKHHTMKFLAWKLSMSVNELQVQLKAFRMSKGSSTTTFEAWLNNRLVNILVLSGFYDNYTTANQAINAGFVSINGLVVKNGNMLINVGDLITMSIFNVVQASNVSGLVIDYMSGSIFVQTIPNVLSNIITQLNKEMFIGEVETFLLNPMNHWVHYTSPVLVRGFNR